MKKSLIAKILVAIACLPFLSSSSFLRADAQEATTADREHDDGEKDRLYLLSLPRNADEKARLRSIARDKAALTLRTERTKLRDGSGSIDSVRQAAQHFIDAEMASLESPEGRARALTKHLALLHQFEIEAAKKRGAGK